MRKKLTLLLAVVGLTYVQAQTARQHWSSVNENEIKQAGERVIVPQKYKTFRLVNDHLKNLLWSAPHENSVKLQESQVIIELPMPDGTMKKYRVVESPVMAPELSAQFPDIKTFNVMGVDEPGVYGKLDYSEMGFHAMIRKVGDDIFIDPFCQGNYTDYISYNSTDYTNSNKIYPEADADFNKNYNQK